MRQPPAVVLDQEPDEVTRRERRVRVLLHNDDFTPAEYVVKLLERPWPQPGKRLL